MTQAQAVRQIFCSQGPLWVNARRGSTIVSVSAWHANGPEFDPHVRHILSWRFGHEKNFYDPLPLIQEEQLSVTA